MLSAVALARRITSPLSSILQRRPSHESHFPHARQYRRSFPWRRTSLLALPRSVRFVTVSSRVIVELLSSSSWADSAAFPAQSRALPRWGGAVGNALGSGPTERPRSPPP